MRTVSLVGGTWTGRIYEIAGSLSWQGDPRGYVSNWPGGFEDRAGPDLADAATLGCLLALVRDAWSDADAYACNLDGYDGAAWVCVAAGDPARFPFGVGHHHGDTEAEALVAALEAAP
jgi:hypothetical protein